MVKTYTAKEIIVSEYRGSKNFMTPKVLKYGKLSRYTAYELSRGSGMFGNQYMYGVSIVSIQPVTGKTSRSSLSKGGFSSLSDATAYISRVKRRVMARAKRGR